MIQVTRPVLIAAVAGVVAIAAISVAAWRLSSIGGTGPGVVAQGSSASAGSGGPPAALPQLRPPVDAAGGAATKPEPSPALPPPERQAVVAPSQTPPPAAESAPAMPSAAPAAKPSFDVVRIDPTGEAVIAGRAEPRAQVALTRSGKPVAQAQADADGQFVMLPPKLPPGDHVLGLSATGPGGDTASEQTVAIAVPARGERESVAALTAPNKPTVVLSAPSPQAGGAAAPLRISTVEAQQGGAFYASGVAPPGASLRIYLNESFLTSVEAGTDGKWSVRVERGLTPGAYRVRADQVGADGRALARVEAPFDYPVELARAAPAKPATAETPVGSPPPTQQGAATAARPADAQNAVVEDLRTARVERGDSLWRISRSIYGEGVRYTQIYDANASQIRNPDLIYPGQVLVVPKQDNPAAGERRR